MAMVKKLKKHGEVKITEISVIFFVSVMARISPKDVHSGKRPQSLLL